MDYIDTTIFVGCWLIAQRVFRGYEADVHLGKRLTKFFLLGLVSLLVHQLAGRLWFYVLLFLAACAIAFLHGYWFHYRHGTHWRTAEPRDRFDSSVRTKVDPIVAYQCDASQSPKMQSLKIMDSGNSGITDVLCTSVKRRGTSIAPRIKPSSGRQN